MHQSLVILLALPLGIYLGVSLIIHHPLNNLLLLLQHRQVNQVLHDRSNINRQIKTEVLQGVPGISLSNKKEEN